jgi:hypothetical protein
MNPVAKRVSWRTSLRFSSPSEANVRGSASDILKSPILDADSIEKSWEGREECQRGSGKTFNKLDQKLFIA